MSLIPCWLYILTTTWTPKRLAVDVCVRLGSSENVLRAIFAKEGVNGWEVLEVTSMKVCVSFLGCF